MRSDGPFIALNITSDEAKLVRFGQQNGYCLVQGFWHLQPAHQGAGAPIQDRVRRIVEEEIPGTRRTLLVVSSEEVIYRHFSFPFTSSKKIAEAIRFEISDEFPFTRYIVHSIESVSIEPGMKSFIVGIVEREVLQNRVRAADEAGLSVIGITSDVSTLGDYFIDENEALVMEAGQRQALFILYSHRVPILVREISIGLRDLLEQEGELKIQTVKPLVSEIKRTVLSFNAKSHFGLNRVYLSGSLIRHRNLIQALNEATDLHFIDQPPSGREFKILDHRTDLNTFASLLGTNRWKKKTGVFDFYREALGGTNQLASGWTCFRWGTMVLICFLLAFFLSSWIKILVLQQRDGFLQSESRRVFTAAFPNVTRIVDEVRQARTLAEAKKYESDAHPLSSVSVLELLDLMSQVIPREVSFQIVNLFWERGRVEIDGRTDSFKTVNVIQELLSKSRDFPEVTISNAKTRSDGQDVDFKITMRIAG
jgi:type II secretory pathway component PulL